MTENIVAISIGAAVSLFAWLLKRNFSKTVDHFDKTLEKFSCKLDDYDNRIDTVEKEKADNIVNTAAHKELWTEIRQSQKDIAEMKGRLER